MIEVGESPHRREGFDTSDSNLGHRTRRMRNALARPAGRPRARDEQRSYIMDFEPMYCTVWIARGDGGRAGGDGAADRQQADRCDGRSCAVCLFASHLRAVYSNVSVWLREPARERLLHKMKMMRARLASLPLPCRQMLQFGEVGAKRARHVFQPTIQHATMTSHAPP